jgi:hypothetical protein
MPFGYCALRTEFKGMVMMKLKYPNMRNELLDHLQALSDSYYQEEVWVKGRPWPGIEHDELDYAVHFMFDDTCLSRDPAGAIGWFLNDDEEVAAVGRVVAALQHIFSTYGTELDDAAYIAKPEWLHVLSAANDAKELLLMS